MEGAENLWGFLYSVTSVSFFYVAGRCQAPFSLLDVLNEYPRIELRMSADAWRRAPLLRRVVHPHAGPGQAWVRDPALAFYPGSRGSRGPQRLFSLGPDT